MELALEATRRAEDAHFWFIGLRRVARQMLDAVLGGRRLDCVLDCGAGTGRNLDWLRNYGNAVGVELTPYGLAAGRARGRRLVGGSVAGLPFADASVDLATSFDVIYCLDDEAEVRALREMWRVLKPGGIVLINVAALEILRGSHSTLTQEVRRYTPSGLRHRLTAAGFSVRRMTFTNMAPFPFLLAVRSFDRLTGRVKQASDADLRVPPRLVNAVLNTALALEALALKAVNLPIGSSLMALAEKRASTGPVTRDGAAGLR